MTFSPLPAEPSAFLAHLDDHGVARHAAAAARILLQRGVDIPPALVDELDEIEVEAAARKPGGLAVNMPTALAGADVAANTNGESV